MTSRRRERHPAAPLTLRTLPGRCRPALLAAGTGLVLALAACASSRPDTELLKGSSQRTAEDVIVVAAQQGPIPLQHDEPPTVLGGAGADQDIVQLANRGAVDVNALFHAEPFATIEAKPRLVLRFENVAGFVPAQICVNQPPSTGPWFQQPPRLTAVFCKGSQPISAASGTAADTSRKAAELLVTDTVARLFPARSSGGYGGYGSEINLGLGGVIGSGGRSGVGVGIGVPF